MSDVSRGEQLKDEIINLLGETLKISRDEITLENKIEDLSRDSIQLFELIHVFEERYGMKVRYEDLMKIETVSDIVAYIQKSGGKI